MKLSEVMVPPRPLPQAEQAGGPGSRRLPVSRLRPHPMLMLALMLFLGGLVLFQVLKAQPGLSAMGIPGSGILYVFRHAWLAPVLGAILLTLVTPGALKGLLPEMRPWMLMLWVAIAFLSLFGFLRGVDHRLLIFDTTTYGFFAVGVVVGSFPQFWRYLHSYFFLTVVVGSSWIVMQLISSPVSLAEIEGIRTLPNFGAEEYPLLVGAMGSQMQIAAFPLALLLINQYPRSKRGMIIIAISAMFMAFMLFGKRAPTARLLVFAAALVLWMPQVTGSSLFRSNKVVRAIGWVAAISAAFLVVTMVIGGIQVLTNAMAHLNDRLMAIGRTSHAYGYSGAERLVELTFLVGDFSLPDYLVGRGFGGGFPVPTFWTPGMMILEGGVPFHGVHTPHIGLAGPLVKGGLPFMLFFFLAWLKGILRRERQETDRIQRPYRALLAINLVFMCIETMIGVSSLPSVMVLAVCLGRCLSSAPSEMWFHVDQQLANPSASLSPSPGHSRVPALARRA